MQSFNVLKQVARVASLGSETFIYLSVTFFPLTFYFLFSLFFSVLLFFLYMSSFLAYRKEADLTYLNIIFAWQKENHKELIQENR
jgi:hypothetical protein